MVLLTATAMAQRFIPMPRWSPILGRPAAVPDQWKSAPVDHLRSGWASTVERKAALAVRSASRLLPWKPRCLAEAATAQVLLRQMHSPAVVVIGLRPQPDTDGGNDHRGNASGGQWGAHAWLLGHHGAITGGPAAHGFTPTTVFEVPGAITAADLAAGASPARPAPPGHPASP
jgi:hypothetical protein